MPRRLAPALLAATSLLGSLVGCGPPSYPGPAQLLLGTGIYDFVPEAACAPAPIVHGVQGGYHIWTALRARYIDFGGVVVHIRYRQADSDALLYEVPAGEVDFDEIPADRLRAVPLPPDGGLEDRCHDGASPGDAGPPPAEVPGGTDGWGQALAITGFLPAEWNACELNACFARSAVREEVTIVDSDGRTASDARTLLPYFEPGTLSVYCTGDTDAGVVALDLGGFACR